MGRALPCASAPLAACSSTAKPGIPCARIAESGRPPAAWRLQPRPVHQADDRVRTAWLERHRRGFARAVCHRLKERLDTEHAIRLLADPHCQPGQPVHSQRAAVGAAADGSSARSDSTARLSSRLILDRTKLPGMLDFIPGATTFQESSSAQKIGPVIRIAPRQPLSRRIGTQR
jgi:hypothetical protein